MAIGSAITSAQLGSTPGDSRNEPLDLAQRLPKLTASQRRQIGLQMDYHAEAPFWHTVQFDREYRVRVVGDVMRPMSSLVLARWMWKNRPLFEGKRVVDVGTGCGIQALAVMCAGAASVVAGDIAAEACACALDNLANWGLSDSVTVVESDVLRSIRLPAEADVIVCAQPFFFDCWLPAYPVTRGMLDPGVLVPELLRTARSSLTSGGSLLMMAWDFAGSGNDPRTYASEMGWRHLVVAKEKVLMGVQRGMIEVVELSRA